MLHEFAVDPALFSELSNARYLSENFGFEHGRWISKFPSKWQRMAYEAASSLMPAEKTRLEIILARCKHKLLASGRPYCSQRTWISNATSEHARLAFRAVISNENPNCSTFVLSVAQLDESIPEWSVPKGITVRRESTELRRCLEPIFTTCKEILLVDPYFSPFDKKWCDVFIEYIRCAHQSGRVPRRVEVHLDATPRPNRSVPGTKAFQDALEARNQGRPSFVDRLPRAADVLFVRWKQLPQGERIHDRFVLTEVGGVSIPGGLDPGEPGETTDVILLSPSIYLRRWNNYQLDQQHFQPEYEGQVFQPAFGLVDRIRAIGQDRVTVL